MNILVIGNGFDLEHNLPTRYTDFIQYISNREYNNIEEKEIKNEFVNLIKDNMWVEYFKDRIEPNKGWIDFESEISSLVQYLDYMRDKHINNYDYQHRIIANPNFENKTRMTGAMIYERYASRVPKALEKVLSDTPNIYYFNEIYRKNVIVPLVKDLNKLIRALEIYLKVIPESQRCDIISPDIFNKEIDRVLSFNYTDTYERVYVLNKDKNSLLNYGNSDNDKDKIKYDYIHGKAELNHTIEENNMVLGIDEYLKPELRDTEIDFIEFKKYFQRIYKKTGCVYKDWIETIRKDENTIHHMYIFGHSLDITDKEILKELLELDNVKTEIFYYDSDTHIKQIANLVKILGPEQLMKKVYGMNPAITLNQQSPRRFVYSGENTKESVEEFIEHYSKIFGEPTEVKVIDMKEYISRRPILTSIAEDFDMEEPRQLILTNKNGEQMRIRSICNQQIKDIVINRYKFNVNESDIDDGIEIYTGEKRYPLN